MKISTWIKNNYNNATQIKVENKQYINKESFLYEVSFLDEEGNKTYLNLFVSTDITDLYQRFKGFSLSARHNNGICLYETKVDYYIYKNTNNKTFKTYY